MIRTYNLELDAEMHPVLVVAEEYDYCVDESRLDTPEKTVKLMNTCFHLGKKAEEYVYAISVDQNMHPLDIFQISHGTATYSLLNPRELLIRMLLSGGTQYFLIHNHPSCSSGMSLPTPSDADQMITERIEEVCRMAGIRMVDHIIIGGDVYYSFKESMPEMFA